MFIGKLPPQNLREASKTLIERKVRREREEKMNP
jgi:hypothetical protein